MVPRDRARAIFASLDGEPKSEAPSPAPEEKPPVAKAATAAEPKEGQETAAEETEAASTEQTEEQLPDSIRKALKEISDPAVRKRVTNDHFRLKEFDRVASRLGMKAADIGSYLTKAVKVAPSVDVLDHISATAEVANGLVEDYNAATPESFSRYAAAQFKLNPKAFVDYYGFLLGNYDTLYQGLRNTNPVLARSIQTQVDSLADSRVKNLVANLRKAGEKEGQEVLGEVAAELEKYLGWDKASEGPKKPSAPDPRDVELARLKAERAKEAEQRATAFENHVYDVAGGRLAPKVEAYVKELTQGYPPKAVAKIQAQIEEALYEELLTNKAVKGRAEALRHSGRYDNDHAGKMVDFYTQQGERLIPLVGEPILSDWKETISPVRAKVQARVEQHEKRRDVGATGAPPKPKVEPPPTGKDPKALFDYLDRVAER